MTYGRTMSEQSPVASPELAIIANELKQVSMRLSWILNFVAVLALILAVAIVLVLGGFVSIEVTVDA